MGGEIRVNGYQNNWQKSPDILTFADGGFLVTWDGYFNNYDGGPNATYVAQQRFNASGYRISGEQYVNAIDDTASYSARTTRLADGGYVVTWMYDDYADIITLRTEIWAKVFNANGVERTDAFRVDTVSAENAILPEVFATDAGFSVVWGVERSDALDHQLYRQNYTANGVAIGGNQLVNTVVGTFEQDYARSATLTGGRTITIWNSEGTFDIGQRLDHNEIRGMVTNPDGTVRRADFHLSLNYGTVQTEYGRTGLGYDVAALNNGGFVISQKNYDYDLGLSTPDIPYYTVFQMFDAYGRATSGKFIAFGSDDLPGQTRIAQLETGQIVVVWEQDSRQGQIGDDIYGRIFSASGQALTSVFEIGVDNGGTWDVQSAPELEALPGGGFVVAYQSQSIDADDEGIAARIYGRATVADDVVTVDTSGSMAGLGGDDRVIGNSQRNALSGNAGKDTLVGDAGSDWLYGGGDADALFGGDGNDRLAGGTGSDVLGGGAGADLFVFDTALATSNRDRITAFAGEDTIVLENAIFTGTGTGGALSSSRFRVLGSGSVDADDRILYDRATGTLYHDANGSGAGGRIAFAVIDTKPALDAGDFLVI